MRRQGALPVTDPLLPRILAFSDEEATSHGRRWRSSKDLDSIDWRHALMVPMIREELLQRLIPGDPDAPRLTGLVRRAWTFGTTRAALADRCDALRVLRALPAAKTRAASSRPSAYHADTGRA